MNLFCRSPADRRVRQQSLEFADFNLDNGVFVEALTRTLETGVEGTIQKPDQLMPIEPLAERVNGRMKAFLGPTKAITATARKLALMVYRVLKDGMRYVDPGQDWYESQYRERVIKAPLSALIVSITTPPP